MTSWDDTNLGHVVYEAVYPAHPDFIFLFKFVRFLKIFFINIDKNSGKTQTYYVYTWRIIECKYSIGPYIDAVGLLLSRQSVLQVTHPQYPHFRTLIKGGVFHVADRRRWVFVANSTSQRMKIAQFEIQV